MNKLTVITHIYNEEYLLPFWLEHHSKIFDHGIIIDYCSTDRSVEIIKKICPTWDVFTTKNINWDGTPNFAAELIDTEVCQYEMLLTGYKISLTITEFLLFRDCISKKDFVETLEPGYYYAIKSYSMISSENIENIDNEMEKNKIIEQQNYYPKNLYDFFNDIKYISRAHGRGHRFIHSDPHGRYFVGRHTLFNVEEYNKVYLSDCIILWCGYYPYNKEMYKRKLQIQKNIPITDRMYGYGLHHLITMEDLQQKYIEELQISVSLEKYDKNVVDIIKQYIMNYS
jgi:hypothetical protein